MERHFMIYEISVEALPDVTHAYFVQRRTVLQIADPDTLLIFASEGRCRITIDNRDYVLNKGSMLVIPEKRHYVRRPIENEMCTLYYAHLRLCGGISELRRDEAAKILESRIKSRNSALLNSTEIPAGQQHRYLISAFTDLSDRFDEVMALWNALIGSMVSNRFDRATLCSLSAVRLLLLLAVHEENFADQPRPAGADSHYLRLRRVINYIRLHVKESISLDDLCEVCNFSKQHLIRVFKTEFGQTPKAYILEHKVSVAKELFFRNPYLSVKEVSDEMGFDDQHYFSRLFTKVTGLTPTAYKRHLLTFDPSKQ